jgi:hypothetical protein
LWLAGFELCLRKNDVEICQHLRKCAMQDFKKLQVWQKAHALTLGIDRASKRIRGSQYASLRNQIFRAAAAIPANIAEGRRQKSQRILAGFSVSL